MKKIKNIDLWIILGVVTILAVITTVLLAVKPFTAKSFEKLEHVTVENYKTKNKNKEEYFVLLYDSLVDNERLEECVLDYAEYARTHSDAPKIYIIDYRNNKSITGSSHFNISDSNVKTQIPCLGTITTSGSLTSKKTNVSDICNLLEDYMIGKK